MLKRVPITFHSPEGLIPPHRVTRPEQVEELRRDIEKRGWQGPPLIGYYNEHHQIQLLSGTHRHAAQLRNGWWVPVKVYPYSFITRCWGRLARWAALMQGRL